MIGGTQPKVLLTQDKDGKLKMNWRLERGDGLIRESNDVLWLEFDKNGRGKERYSEPAIGRSLIMSPFNDYFTWQTTTVTDIVEQREDYIEFRTINSNYKLTRIEQ